MQINLNKISVKRTINALEKYLELSEEKIQESETQEKKNGTLYNGNVVRFHDSYINDIVKELKNQMED
jgi:hypothetical protein